MSSDDSGLLDNLLDGGILGTNASSFERTEQVTVTSLIGEVQEYEMDDDADGFSKEMTIVLPNDRDVLQSTLERIQSEGAKEHMREEVGVVERPDESIENPQILLDDFQRVLNSLHDELLPRLSDTHTIEQTKRNLGDERPDPDQTFAYVLAEHDRGYIVGGASNIIDNIADILDFSPEEREFVRLAYEQSVKVSSLGDIQGHTAIDDVVYVWADDSMASTAEQSEQRVAEESLSESAS